MRQRSDGVRLRDATGVVAQAIRDGHDATNGRSDAGATMVRDLLRQAGKWFDGAARFPEVGWRADGLMTWPAFAVYSVLTGGGGALAVYACTEIMRLPVAVAIVAYLGVSWGLDPAVVGVARRLGAGRSPSVLPRRRPWWSPDAEAGAVPDAAGVAASIVQARRTLGRLVADQLAAHAELPQTGGGLFVAMGEDQVLRCLSMADRQLGCAGEAIERGGEAPQSPPLPDPAQLRSPRVRRSPRERWRRAKLASVQTGRLRGIGQQMALVMSDEQWRQWSSRGEAPVSLLGVAVAADAVQRATACLSKQPAFMFVRVAAWLAGFGIVGVLVSGPALALALALFDVATNTASTSVVRRRRARRRAAATVNDTPAEQRLAAVLGDIDDLLAELRPDSGWARVEAARLLTYARETAAAAVRARDEGP